MATEGSHVKTNLVHTLYRVQKYGLQPLEKFVEMLRPSERKQCVVQPEKRFWYSMPMDVFTAFVFRVSNIALNNVEVLLIFFLSY